MVACLLHSSGLNQYNRSGTLLFVLLACLHVMAQQKSNDLSLTAMTVLLLLDAVMNGLSIADAGSLVVVPEPTESVVNSADLDSSVRGGDD